MAFKLLKKTYTDLKLDEMLTSLSEAFLVFFPPRKKKKPSKATQP